jgi:hypothetical protein
VSNDRAIAAVTATLRTLIFRAVGAEPDLGAPQVTTRPPDRARQAVPGNLLNIFLYRTSLDPAWRNQPMPPARPAEAGVPPLALTLSYLLTAYGDNDDEVMSHRLLGVAMSMLHSQPILAPTDIAAALPGSDLENQVEQVRITPHPIPLDEISRMWATFQTGYRISVSYEVSVVLIENTQPQIMALPVLTVGEGDVGPTVVPSLAPLLDFASAPNDQPGLRPGDLLTLWGRGLEAVTQVAFSGPHIAPGTILVPSGVATDRIEVTLPTKAPLPAGTATVTVLAGAPQGPQLASNAIPVGIVPVLTGKLPLKAKLANQGATITVSCTPPVQAGQTVCLILGDRAVPGVPGPPASAPRSKIPFDLSGFTANTYTLRLEVDGQRSIPLAASGAASGAPLAFDPQQSAVLS